MKTYSSPKFVIAGKITPDTKVFGVAHERFSKAIAHSFAGQFSQLEKATNKSKTRSNANPQPERFVKKLVEVSR